MNHKALIFGMCALSAGALAIVGYRVVSKSAVKGSPMRAQAARPLPAATVPGSPAPMSGVVGKPAESQRPLASAAKSVGAQKRPDAQPETVKAPLSPVPQPPVTNATPAAQDDRSAVIAQLRDELIDVRKKAREEAVRLHATIDEQKKEITALTEKAAAAKQNHDELTQLETYRKADAEERKRQGEVARRTFILNP